ncbi:DUF5752 family protein [Alteromonas sp.]|uniref:DUF5752 family protein n=1 Tax=Alteromonas TaxID=226 RepID=UPI00338E0330
MTHYFTESCFSQPHQFFSISREVQVSTLFYHFLSAACHKVLISRDYFANWLGRFSWI